MLSIYDEIKKQSVDMVKFADRFDITKLRINLFVEDLKGMDGLYAQLAKLPIDLVLKVICHPATVICNGNPAQNEETLFQIVMARFSTEAERRDYILKLLESIHLPQASAEFLETTEGQFGHIAGVKDLIKEAKTEVNPGETREWYLPRYENNAPVKIRKQNQAIVVNGLETFLYSSCVLVGGFPFYLHVFTKNGKERYGIESPVQIERLGLPYQLKVRTKGAKNVYYSGKVEKGSGHWDHPRDNHQGYLKVERC